VLFFGRIWPYKGLEFLIRAEPYIAEAVPDVRIVIAGEGENFARYRAMMGDPGRYVIRNEFVSDAERSQLFSEAVPVDGVAAAATGSGQATVVLLNDSGNSVCGWLPRPATLGSTTSRWSSSRWSSSPPRPIPATGLGDRAELGRSCPASCKTETMATGLKPAMVPPGRATPDP